MDPVERIETAVVHLVQNCAHRQLVLGKSWHEPAWQGAAAVAQEQLSKPGKTWHLWGSHAGRQRKKTTKQHKTNPLLTFGETGQEANIYILGAFGWVVFFIEREFFLEAGGCRKNTSCYWNSGELWETGFVYRPTAWVILRGSVNESETDQTVRQPH